MPILKQLVSSSSQSKRRSRVDLTAEMISAPLGDFRHTMHVGRGGDAFGDTSFLSTRSGEPPRESQAQPSSPGSKPGLLSRTFRSSKRSQSVTRADKQEAVSVPAIGDSIVVKNAVSLPHLNDEDVGQGGRVPKSLSTTPLKKLPEADSRAINGASATRALELELEERRFGELTELPRSVGGTAGGMKHAESIMSFHVDLGPSMLGDILSVMDKGWDEDDLGYEEGKSSEGHASPQLSGHRVDAGEDREDLRQPPVRPPRLKDVENHTTGPYTPEPQVRQRQYLDSCSVSSSGSTGLEDKPHGQPHGGDTDSAKFSSPQGDEEKDFSFMDEDDDDEIRV